MKMTLEEFLEMDIDDEIKEVEIPRLKLTFQLRSLTAEESKEIVIGYRRLKKVNNIKISQEDEDTEVTLRQVVSSIIYPPLEDERLLRKYKTTEPTKVLMKMLRPGEYMKILQAFMQINNIETTPTDKMIEEAKN